MTRLVAMFAACAALAGCGGLFITHAQPSIVYTPTVPVAPAQTPRHEAVLVVARPESGPGLDSDAIAVALPGRRLDALSGARWSASVPEIVQDYLVRSLGGREGWRAVVSDHSAFAGDYLLQTDIRAFTAQYATPGQPPRVQVWLHAELGSSRARTLLASIDARGEAQAGDDRQGAIVAAFDAAFADAVKSLGDQVYAAAEPRH